MGETFSADEIPIRDSSLLDFNFRNEKFKSLGHNYFTTVEDLADLVKST